ncbi:hypothetical protein JCM3770_000049 [Rhodotorula araucariae]
MAALAEDPHCFPPAHTPHLDALAPRARSGSRTYTQAQDDERQLARSRTRSRERAAAVDALEGRTSSAPSSDPLDSHTDGQMSINELRQEMETLLSLRRRSMSQPVAVDPDLPPTAPPTSAPSIQRPSLSLAIPTLTEGPGGGPVSPTAPAPAETGTLVRRRSSVGGRLPSEHPLPVVPPLPSPTLQLPHSPYSVDPSAAAPATPSQNLYWLPASLHPELAPAEFKAFIREQTRPEALARRTSLSAGGVAGVGPAAGGRMNRRASLLRGEYKPRANDGVGDAPREQVPPVPALQRTASDGGARGQRRSRNTLNFEELTIKDLQRLEELAAKAEADGTTDGEVEEGERLGRVLRRSLSLNPHRVAAAAASAGASFGSTLPSTIEEGPTAEPLELDNDEAPIIVPPPGQILRRNARTRIRKASIGGEGGGGSRFGSARRGRTSTSSSTHDHELEAGSDGGHEPATSSSGVEGSSPDGDGEVPSPPTSELQHVEPAPIVVAEPDQLVTKVQEQASIPRVVLERPQTDAEPVQLTAAPVPEPVVTSAIEPAASVKSAPPAQHAISPASAEYDWSTHHLPAQHPSPSPAAVEPQYTVHPQHLPRQPFDSIPPPQAVPLPLPQAQARKEVPVPPPSVAPVRPDSPKPSVKEKKSGWARLGLGRDEDSKKRKGKAKERERSEYAGTAAPDKERERDRDAGGSSSGSFLSGLFGRKRVEHDPAPPRAPSPPPAPRIPPPPPTASGVLLPNGRYANFYRLPIHVERAVYRLSHIKLANPRRPLYEQVLISNLMFWYLGLIQKPVAPPPPAGPPVPIPGLPSPSSSSTPGGPPAPPASPPQKEHKRIGLSKPSRAPGRPAAEMPMRTVSYEVQNAQLAEEQHRYAQHGGGGSTGGGGGYHPHPYLTPSPGSSAPQQQASTSSPVAPLAPIARPLSSTAAPSSSPPEKPRSLERTSAPAAMYARPSLPPSPSPSPAPSPSAGALTASQGAGAHAEEDEDEDRPLVAPHAQVQQQRASPPPPAPALQPQRSPGRPQAFEVTSRRVSGGAGAGMGAVGAKHERRASAVSDASFDAGEIYDAYAPPPPPPPAPPASPGAGTGAGPGSGPSVAKELPAAAPARALGPAAALALERPPGAVLGAVAPRGSSLRALSR